MEGTEDLRHTHTHTHTHTRTPAGGISPGWMGTGRSASPSSHTHTHTHTHTQVPGEPDGWTGRHPEDQPLHRHHTHTHTHAHTRRLIGYSRDGPVPQSAVAIAHALHTHTHTSTQVVEYSNGWMEGRYSLSRHTHTRGWYSPWLDGAEDQPVVHTHTHAHAGD
jgi:hypothetical protein